jgi:hypothetical protein
MFDRKVFLAAVLAVCGSQAVALPVRVTLEWPAGIPASGAARAHIRALWTEGPASNGVPAGVEAEAGQDGAVLELGDGVWHVEATASGYWSKGAEVVVARKAAASVRLALWPAASLHGEIRAAEGEPLPEFLDVRLSAIRASAMQSEPSPSSAELRCQIEEGSWSCLGPAGLFDARLEIAGYTPHYEWGVSMKAAESTGLGRFALLRTASVFGRAVRKGGSNPPGPCRATLRPEVMRGGGVPVSDPDGARQVETSFSVPLSQRGYFQVLGVSSGMYTLDVECQAASGVREVSVQANTETRIDPLLLLGELTLDINIAPKADPAGLPWQLTVDATAPSLRRLADKARTSEDGRWERRGLAAGSYRVMVNSSDGTPWLQRDLELGAGSGPLSLRMAFARVAGRVLLSMQPVRGRLVFFNDEAGGQPVTLTSDEDGRFQGILPVASDARETSWIVEAHSDQLSSSRRLESVNVPLLAGGARAWLELDLPAIAVRGTVVSDDGQPQRGVEVTFEDARRARTTTSTDDAGYFELPDLPPGKYTAVAESDEGVSEHAAVEVVDGVEKELRLVLNPSARITFHVVSSQGPVTDAAVQVWIAPGTPRSLTHTDQDGAFEVKLPPGTAEVGLTVGAPGYALKMTRMPVSTTPLPTASEGDVSADANTIKLDPSGGTLMLNLQPPSRSLDEAGTAYLVHNGAIEDAGTLAGWGTDQAGASGDGQAVVEAIEPGAYALCLLADATELATLWQSPPSPERCRKGSVERGRTLSLSPRWPERR